MWNTRLSELEFDGDELAASLGAIDSGWITAGPRTLDFEEAFARVAGTREAVAVSNGTAALILALKAVGVGSDDEVLCPSLTFAATAAAIIHCGAKPVFVDIRGLEDPTMDPRGCRPEGDIPNARATAGSLRGHSSCDGRARFTRRRQEPRPR